MKKYVYKNGIRLISAEYLSPKAQKARARKKILRKLELEEERKREDAKDRRYREWLDTYSDPRMRIGAAMR